MRNNTLKKLLTLIIIAVNVIVISIIPHTETINAENLVSPNTKDRLELIKERGVLNVVSSDNYPFSYIDPKTNEYTGLNGEIIKEVARRLGIKKVELKKIVPFGDLLVELNNNDDIDIMPDRMFALEERKKLVLFTNVFYKDTEAIIIPKFSKITGKEDLKNAVVGVQKGTVLFDLAQRWKEKKLVKDVAVFKDQYEVLSAINTLKVDAGITDTIHAKYLLTSDNKLYLKLLNPYEPEIPGMVAAAVRKSDTSLAAAINKEIDGMKNDKTLLKILESYGLNENYFVSVEEGNTYRK